MKEQIEEMALIMCGRESCKTCTHFIDATKCAAVVSAKKLYNAGYRKQKEGEWKMLIYNKHCSCGKSQKVARYECSVCKRIADMQPYGLSFCPNCGAKMKGGAE
jgi:hypothetical protein